MKAAPLSVNEEERIQSLNEHELLDTLPEDIYDEITRLASEITGTPTSLISLVDRNRQWFKSRHNHPVEETPRELSFCAHAILHSDEVMIVPDARYDDRFHDHPDIIGGIQLVFYAGVPITDILSNGLGTLCVIDHRPRELSDHQLEALKALAKLVNAHLELRKTKMDLDKAQDDLRMIQSLVNTMQAEMKDLLKNNPQPEQLKQVTSAIESTVGALKDIHLTPQREQS